MASDRYSEKASPTETIDPTHAIDLGQNKHAVANPVKRKSRSARAFKFWSFLLAYSICCIALSVILAVVVNGFNAADSTTPRYINGKLQLRVADITTLISAGLVVIKLLVTSWTAVAVWRCAYEFTHSTEMALSPKQLSFMTKYKLPPWVRSPFGLPKEPRSWIISAILLLMLPQQFIAPLLSGAVDWNPTSVPGGTTVLVNSSDPLADPGVWYQYVIPSYVDKRNEVYKVATGLASLPWSDSSTVSQNGTSLTGNGCRHVVNDDGLPAGSTLTNAVVPCIKFHDISWATSDDQIPSSYENTVFQTTMSIINDSLSHYTNPGHAVLFDPNLPWNGSDGDTSTLFSGTKVLALNIANTYDCTKIGINNFGNVNTFPQHIVSWALGTCYIFANVTFTAGVTTSAMSTYLSSRVIEDQTPIDQVVFESSAWVQQSFWLLPDLMTIVSLANSSQLPTWNNVDLYAENLIRQSYLAAWDSFHQEFDAGGVVSTATPVESRIQATVSNSRVFAWLAISLLTSVGGALLLLLTFGEQKLDLPTSVTAAQKKEAKKDTKRILDDLASLDFF